MQDKRGVDATDVTNSCENEATRYTLYVTASMSLSVTSVSIWGHPLNLSPGAVTIVDEDLVPVPLPDSISIKHDADTTTMGSGTVMYDVPRESNRGVLNLGIDGPGWLRFANPVNSDIEHVTLWTEGNEEWKPFNDGQSGRLIFPVEPHAELYLLGIPPLKYTKISFQTVNGIQGEYTFP